MKTWFLPLGLLLALAAGLLSPQPGAALASQRLLGLSSSEILVVLVFLISGMQVRLDELKAPGRFKRTILASLFLNLLLAPCLFFALPFLDDPGLRLGIAVMLCVPTTLSSAIVIAENAGGNRSLAVALTVALTLVGIPLLPYSFSWLEGGAQPGFSTTALLMKMSALSLLPLAAGAALRKALSLTLPWWSSPVSSLCVILTVWMAVSRNESAMLSAPSSLLLASLALGVLAHALLLVASWSTAKAMGLARPERVSFLFVTSQKTVVVGIAVLLSLPELLTAGRLAAATVAGVLFHLSQILMDSLIAPKLRR